jgi:transposase
VAEPVRVRRLSDQEGQKLQRIVRRGSTSSVRYRRAMMLLASAGGNRVPVIAQLVQADEDTVRDVIHRFNEIGLAALDPRWAGGRPRLLSPDDEDFVVATAKTRPTRLGRPFTRWSIRKLAGYLHTVPVRETGIGREALRCLLARRGVTFQRTKTWKESTDPQYGTKLDRIEHVLEHLPDRVFAFDEFGPLGIRPTGGNCWAEEGRPARVLRVTRHERRTFPGLAVWPVLKVFPMGLRRRAVIADRHWVLWNADDGQAEADDRAGCGGLGGFHLAEFLPGAFEADLDTFDFA